MSTAAFGRVFISYRRQDARGSAGRIYDRLVGRFGYHQVFMDVDRIALGVDFAKVIAQAVSTCEVLLAVIGPRWLDAKDEDGRRRLDDPSDFVRLEIAAALERDIRVIPILVEDAAMPRRQQLPENLAGLADRNAHKVRHDSFDYDTDRLLVEIEHINPPRPAAAVPVAVDPTDVAPIPSVVQMLRHDHDVNDVAFSPDGRLLATACDDRTARVWEVASGQQRILVRHDSFVRGVAFNPTGRLLATASSDKTARVWELASGQQRTLMRHDAWVRAVAFSPDGRLLATSSLDETARVWELASGQQRALIRLEKWGYSVAFSPDGRLLATASSDWTARVWRVASSLQRDHFTHAVVTHNAAVLGVAFSPDGRLLATASTDKTARVWDVASSQQRILVTHDGAVRSVAFSPDGRLLATASYDKTARVWEIASGQQLSQVTRDGAVNSVAFSPDGSLLATGSDDDSAHVWALAR